MVFLQEWPGWREELVRLIGGSDALKLKRLAHTIKGSMAQFAAGRAYELAQRLEKLAHDGKIDEAAEPAGLLAKEIDRLLGAFAALVNEQPVVK